MRPFKLDDEKTGWRSLGGWSLFVQVEMKPSAVGTRVEVKLSKYRTHENRHKICKRRLKYMMDMWLQFCNCYI